MQVPLYDRAMIPGAPSTTFKVDEYGGQSAWVGTLDAFVQGYTPAPSCASWCQRSSRLRSHAIATTSA
jgi:hypothetical protein